MRKLICQQWLSLDGYAADANGSVSFIEPFTGNKYSDYEQLQWLGSIDTILLGANTYELFVDFWPTATNDIEIISDTLNSIPKIIFSRTLAKAPWGHWPEADISRDAVKTVTELKEKEGKDMVIWGSISITQQLMKEKLIDEYHFRLVPKALGKGRELFGPAGPLQLELLQAKNYHSGIVLLQYRAHNG